MTIDHWPLTIYMTYYDNDTVTLTINDIDLVVTIIISTGSFLLFSKILQISANIFQYCIWNSNFIFMKFCKNNNFFIFTIQCISLGLSCLCNHHLLASPTWKYLCWDISGSELSCHVSTGTYWHGESQYSSHHQPPAYPQYSSPNPAYARKSKSASTFYHRCF